MSRKRDKHTHRLLWRHPSLTSVVEALEQTDTRVASAKPEQLDLVPPDARPVTRKAWQARLRAEAMQAASERRHEDHGGFLECSYP